MNRARIRVSVVAIVIACLGATLPAAPIAALSCAYFTPRIIVREFRVIYVGVVSEVLSHDDMLIRYRMDVRRTIKGEERSHRVLRSEGMDMWSEPVELAPGTRVLVVGNEIGNCSPSTTHRVRAQARRFNRLALQMSGRIPARHVVERGEWLWSIARDRLRFDRGDPTPRQIRRAADKIYDRNRARIGSNPDRLAPGTRLRIPRLR